MADSLDRNLGKELAKLIYFKRWGEPKSINLGYNYFFHCKICREQIVEAPLLCSECFAPIHNACSKKCNNSCGSEGTVPFSF